LISTPLAFHENNTPMIIFRNNLTAQQKFIDDYNADKLIIIGKHVDTSMPHEEFLGNATSLSLKIAKFFGKSSNVVIVPYNMDGFCVK